MNELSVAVGQVKKCFCSHSGLSGCSPENKLSPSNSPAVYRALGFLLYVSETCRWAGKWCSEWLLQTVLCQAGLNFNVLIFPITIFKPEGNPPFSLFPQASCALTLKTLWIHKIKSKLLLLTVQNTQAWTVMHYFKIACENLERFAPVFNSFLKQSKDIC